MRYRLVAAGIWSATTIGSCGLDEGGWASRAAKAECDHLRRCDTSTWARLYEDEAGCRDTKEREWREAALVGCVFDELEAEQCLEAFRSDCTGGGDAHDDLVAPCLRVWSCGAPLETSDTAVTPL